MNIMYYKLNLKNKWWKISKEFLSLSILLTISILFLVNIIFYYKTKEVSMKLGSLSIKLFLIIWLSYWSHWSSQFLGITSFILFISYFNIII